MTEEPVLTPEEINDQIYVKLKDYKKLSVLEQYAMFIGKAQILELGLKQLLFRNFDVPINDMEKWTLGQTRKKLEEKGLRSDFIALLEEVVDYRNYMAHEFLVNNAITQSLVNFSDRKLYGDLFKAIHTLEYLMIVYDWIEEHNCWQ